MIHRVLVIGRWVVDFLFAEEDYDIDGVLACMHDSGASRTVMAQAEELMDEREDNCGFTFSNPRARRAVVVIGPTTSGREFQDTFVHEIYHLASAIADSIGVPLSSEHPAYMAGDSARALAEVVCELGCDHCRR